MERSRPPGTYSSNHSARLLERESRLAAIAASAPIQHLAAALGDASLFLVGGSVREAVSDGTRGQSDLDVATAITAHEVQERCEAHGLKVVATGIQHGTVLVVAADTHIEVTTFREPSDRESHTTAGSIERDLSGRDFTINAIAYDLISHSLVDPFGGIADLEAGLLRAVNDPSARFIEDPLRILRMIRFGPAAGRTVDEKTIAAARAHVDSLTRVSPERIHSELDRILMELAPAEAFRMIVEIGALPYTVPELIPAIGFEQNKFHIHDVFEHTMWVLSRTPPDLILRWAALLHDAGKPHTLSVDEDGNRHFYGHEVVSERLARERTKALRFSHDQADAICLIVQHHMRPLDCGAPGVRRIMRDLGSELTRWRTFKEADMSPTMPLEEFASSAASFDALLAVEQERLAGPAYGKLAVSGGDILELGIKPGPIVGKILRLLEEAVIDDPTRNTREWLLAQAKHHLSSLAPSN